MFKKTADLLGNTDLSIVGTPKIFGNVAVNSDQEFPNLKNNGTCEFRVEIKSSVSPYPVTTETFTFDSNTLLTITQIKNHLNTLTSNLVFDSAEGCLSVESAFSGHKAYIKILTKTTSSTFDPLPLMGFFAHPHPSGFSEAKDLQPAPVKPVTQGNHHGTLFVSRKEDRLSSAINRSLASVAMNSEHTQLQISKPVAVGIQIEIDSSTHANRLHLNSASNTYDYIYLGPNGNDSVDQAIAGRRVFVGGLSETSNIRRIEGAFLIKSLENRTLLSDSLDFIRVGAVVSNSAVQPGTTIISAPQFDSVGEVVGGTGLSASSSIYSDYGSVLGNDIAVYSSTDVDAFTKSTIKTSTSIPNAEVGFKVVVSGSNPADYSNDGNYRITKVISDKEIEVVPLSSDEPKILNDQPDGSYSPTITISTGGEFIHHAILLFSPDLVFPASGKIVLALYVESSLEDNSASYQQEALAARSLIVENYNSNLNAAFKGDNPSKDSGYYINPEERGIEIVSESPQVGTVNTAATGPLTGSITSDWVLTAASGEFFYSDSLGVLFKVGNYWARATSLIDYKNIQLVPFRKSQTITTGAVTYYTYSEQNGSISFPASVVNYSPTRAISKAGGFTFIDEMAANTDSYADNGFLHLVQITETTAGASLLNKTADLATASSQITLDFDAEEAGSLRFRESGSTFVCITNGLSPGWYFIESWVSSTQVKLEHADGSGLLSAKANETASVTFYAPVFGTQRNVLTRGDGSDNWVEASAVVRGVLSKRNESAALVVDWDGVGRGIYGYVNDRLEQGGAANTLTGGSTGPFIEAHINPPADGIYVKLNTFSHASTKETSGGYGLKIQSESNYSSLVNSPTFRGATTTEPRASVLLKNEGNDSSIIAMKGRESASKLWSLSIVDIYHDPSSLHDTSYDNIAEHYGYGGALSVRGSWFSRDTSQIYLAGVESAIGTNLILPQSGRTSDKPRLGLTSTSIISSTTGLVLANGPLNHGDFSKINAPHDSSVEMEIQYSELGQVYKCPGQKVTFTFSSGGPVSGMVLAAKADRVSSTVYKVYLATDIDEVDLQGTGTLTKVEVEVATRFRTNSDIEGHSYVGIPDSIVSVSPSDKLGLLQGSLTDADQLSSYYLRAPTYDADDNDLIGVMPRSLQYRFDTLTSSNALYTSGSGLPTSGTAAAVVITTSDGEGGLVVNSQREGYTQKAWIDGFWNQQRSSYSYFFGDFSPSDSVIWPRTSNNHTFTSGFPSSIALFRHYEDSCQIRDRSILNDPLVDNFHIRFPTVYTSTTMPDLQTGEKAYIKIFYARRFASLIVYPVVSRNASNPDLSLVYQICKTSIAVPDTAKYAFKFEAVAGLCPDGPSSTDIKVTPVLLITRSNVNGTTHPSVELARGSTTVLTSHFDTISETFYGSGTQVSLKPDQQLECALEVEHYGWTGNSSQDIALNQILLHKMSLKEVSVPVRINNLEVTGNVIASNFTRSVWKEGCQTVSPAHVDLYTEESLAWTDGNPFDGGGTMYNKSNRLGAGVGLLQDVTGNWWRPTYSREYFFSKSLHAATINLFHPFYDPLWYLFQANRIDQYLANPSNLPGTINELVSWAGGSGTLASDKYVLPGPTGFSIPLDPPHGSVLTSMDWNLHFMGAKKRYSTGEDAAPWGAFWSRQPADSADWSDEISFDSSIEANSDPYSILRWNRVAGARVSLYRINVLSSTPGTLEHNTVEDAHGQGNNLLNGPELIHTAIVHLKGNPISSATDMLSNGRNVVGSAKFYNSVSGGASDSKEFSEHPDNSDLVVGGLGDDMNAHQASQANRYYVDKNHYAYYATITFYGGCRRSLTASTVGWNHHTGMDSSDAQDYADWDSNATYGNSTATNTPNLVAKFMWPYAEMPAGALDRSIHGLSASQIIHGGWKGFRVDHPTATSSPNPKVHFRGFKLNWKTNKV